MSEKPEEIKRWTARRKAEVVMSIIKGKTTATEVARSHDLTVGEVEQWMDDFVSSRLYGHRTRRTLQCL